MKQIHLLIVFISLTFYVRSQNLDSMLRIPQTLELSISTPQPRLKEKFQVTLDANYVRAHIFKSALGKIELAEGTGDADDGKMILHVNALKKGITEIGPLEFDINGTHYKTNKLTYEVIDPLPLTDKGLWFRKVLTSDSTFCIIIEQRIPATAKKKTNPDNSVMFYTQPEFSEIVKIKDAYSIPGVTSPSATTYTNTGSITNAKGELKQFMYGYSIYYFKIVDRGAKIKITRDQLENLPPNYTFEDILIQ